MISIITAWAKNKVIGKDNKLPWKLPADLKRFRELTLGKPVIMGRKTFESIGKPLAGRTNIVITRDKNFKSAGAIVVNSPEEAVKAAGNAGEIMVIGGASVYKEFLPLAQRIYLTDIGAEFEGNAFFPDFNLDAWKTVSREDREADEKNPCHYTFMILERK
ncbi:MAG: type 3 dihydrofolate reductase [Patescibacteria group bacterium]